MAMTFSNRYSVYDRETEIPLIIYASAPECAKAMGVTLSAFHAYATRTTHNRNHGKWLVYKDEVDDDE